MSLFKTKLIDKKGTTEERLIDAQNKEELFEILKKEGSTLIRTEVTKGGISAWWEKISRDFEIVSAKDKITFARNLGLMLEAGLPMIRALSVLKKQSKSKKFQYVLDGIMKGINSGDPLSKTLMLYPKEFSTIFISMIKAGEESGNIALSLQEIANQMEKNYEMSKKVRGAMLYPGIILTVMIIIGILMMIFLVPTLTATFTELEVELPFTTQMVIFISEALKNHIILFLAVIAILIGGFVYFIKTAIGKRSLDYFFIHFPLVSNITKEINSARTTRTLSSLLSAGVDIVSALEVTRDVVGNTYYKAILADAAGDVQKGGLLSLIFEREEKLYPSFVAEMTSVGEETGKISDMMANIAHYYESEVDQKTKNLSTIIEPLLMVLIGIGVGFFAVSMLAPTYSLVDSL